MHVLLHICCGPCSITVLQRLLGQGHELQGLFYNPNIQPLAEYLRRREGAGQAAVRFGVPLIFGDLLPEADQVWSDPWRRDSPIEKPAPEQPLAPAEAAMPDQPLAPARPAAPEHKLPPALDPMPWLRAVAGREEERCAFCVRLRLRFTARLAAQRGFEAFSTSLLYSRYQKHDQIRALGEECGLESGVRFLYEDFRDSWQEGVRLSREWGIYRQPYCGCVFSEYERYAAALDKARKAGG